MALAHSPSLWWGRQTVSTHGRPADLRNFAPLVPGSSSCPSVCPSPSPAPPAFAPPRTPRVRLPLPRRAPRPQALSLRGLGSLSVFQLFARVSRFREAPWRPLSNPANPSAPVSRLPGGGFPQPPRACRTGLTLCSFAPCVVSGRPVGAGIVSSFPGCVPSTSNCAWHIVGAQRMCVEQMDGWLPSGTNSPRLRGVGTGPRSQWRSAGLCLG